MIAQSAAVHEGLSQGSFDYSRLSDADRGAEGWLVILDRPETDTSRTSTACAE